MQEISLKDAVKFVVDNRGKTCPVQETGTPLISTACIDNNQLYPILKTERFVSDETLNNWFRSHPEPMDIILTNKGSKNGQVCLVPNPVDFCIAQDMVALRGDEDKFRPSYLFAALRSPLVQNRIKSLNVDAVIPHFKKTDFDKLLIPCPAPDIQKFIGDQYLTFCEKIELNQKMNETLEEIAKAIFKSWFVDFDPVRAKIEGRPTGLPDGVSDLFPDELVDSEIGEIPEGWEDRKLGEIVKEVGTKTKPSEQTRNSPYVPIDKIHSKSLVLYDHSDGAEAKSSLVRFRKRDILFGAMRPYFHKVCVAPFEGTTRTTCLVLNSIQPEFYAFSIMTLFSESTIDFATQNSTGSTIPYIKWRNELETLRVAAPSLEIANKFNGILEPIIDRFSIAIRERQTLTELRDTLLPKLISGELQIPDAEKFLEEAGI